MKRKALGKGLGALLAPQSSADRVTRVDTGLIVPNKYQPRQNFDEESLRELAVSIEAGGIIQPLIVRRAGEHYELISGERRLQAAKLAGLSKVPVIIRDIDERQALVFALVENLQRENLNAIEESRAIGRLVDEFGLSHQEIGRALGKSRTHVTNMLRLLKLPHEVQSLVSGGKLSFGHAKVIAGVKGEENQKALAEQVVAAGLSVRQTEKLVSRADSPPVPRGTARNNHNSLSPHLRQVQHNLRTVLGVPVRIYKGVRKGRIEIEFSDTNQLDKLLARMLGGSMVKGD